MARRPKLHLLLHPLERWLQFPTVLCQARGEEAVAEGGVCAQRGAIFTRSTS